MPQIISIQHLKDTSNVSALRHHSDIEFSEKQIKQGKTKDAKKALADMRAKYGIIK